MTRENIVACPACDERIDAVDVICETGRCPECRTTVRDLFDAASDDETRSAEDIIEENHALEVDT